MRKINFDYLVVGAGCGYQCRDGYNSRELDLTPDPSVIIITHGE